MLNRTGETINDCVLHWGSQRVEFASEGPNGLSTMAFYSDPIPERARVTWTSTDGARHAAEAVVNRRQGRPGKGGYVCCLLLPDRTLKVEPISQSEYTDFFDAHNTFRVGIKGPQYIIATYNATEHALSDLKVFFGKYQVNAESRTGPRSTDANAGWRFAHGMPYPVTDEIRIVWQSQGRQRQEQLLRAKAKLPQDLNGVCIVFVIDNKPVRMATIPWSKRQRWWMETRP